MDKKITKIIPLFLIFTAVISNWKTALPADSNTEVITVSDPNVEEVEAVPDVPVVEVVNPDNTLIRDDSTVVYTRAVFSALLNAVYIDTSNNIYYSSNIAASSPTWTKIDGTAYEVSLGTDCKMLRVGTDYASDGIIYESAGVSGATANWAGLAGTRASKVSIGANGEAVHIGTGGSVYYRASSSSGWVSSGRGSTIDIAIGSDGKMLQATSLTVWEYSGVKPYNAVNWSLLSGTVATKVTIAKSGEAAHIGGGTIYYRSASGVAWSSIGKYAKEISMANDGTILYIGTDNSLNLYKSGTNTVITTPTTPKKVAINTNSTIKTNLDALTLALASTTLGIGASSDVWPAQKTMFSIVKFFDSISYQGANGGNAIYDKLKSFYDSRTASTNTSDLTYLTNLRALLTESVGKSFLTTTAATGVVVPQSTNVSNWLAQVVTDMTTPGGTKFLFDPSKGTEKAYYAADKWLVSTPNYMVIKFKAQAANDIYVHFVADAGTASSTN